MEEELPWIQEKALDLVEFTGSVTQAIPGPRVGLTSLPWILAVPLGYAALTFVIAFLKTVRNFASPKAQRKKLVGKSALLCKSVDELLQRGRDEVKVDDLKGIENKTGFGLEEILRKYIRYALNEKPFLSTQIPNRKIKSKKSLKEIELDARLRRDNPDPLVLQRTQLPMALSRPPITTLPSARSPFNGNSGLRRNEPLPLRLSLIPDRATTVNLL
ncbi:hypothetical protein RYX36_004390 [Vicia faba]